LACGGKELLISDSTSDAFEDCEASSTFPSGDYKCEFGFNKKMEDSPMCMWVSDGEGVSSWIKVNFDDMY